MIWNVFYGAQVTIIDFEVINFINFETEIRYAESSGIVQVSREYIL